MRTMFTVSLFRRLATSVAESQGLQYPNQTDADVTAYLTQVQRLP